MINNFILARFLGLCSFIAISKKLETAWGMGVVLTFVTTISSLVIWPVYNLVLILMTAIRERLETADTPPLLSGIPQAFLVACFLSLAFMGFSELIVE